MTQAEFDQQVERIRNMCELARISRYVGNAFKITYLFGEARRHLEAHCALGERAA